jgi:cobyrinic acid a,c-diamide synthase
MWPSGGFEPSGFSPAGEVLGLSRLAEGIRGMRDGRASRGATLAAGVIVAFLMAIAIVLVVTTAA